MFNDPTAISIGPLTVQWYAIFIMTGAVLGSVLTGKLAEYRGLKSDAIFDVALVSIIAGVIGARLYYVMLQWDFYGQNPAQILNIPRGGLSIHGAIIFGVAAIVFMTWRMKDPILSWLDVAAPGVALAQSIGRWGNYANQEAFGTPTDRPWGIAIRPENRPAEHADATHFHPTFFYESVLNLGSAALLTFLLVRYSRQTWMRGGDILGLYLILYGVIRLPLEWIRTDSLYIGPLPAAYWLSGALILAGILIMVLNRAVFPATKFGPRDSESDTQPASA